MITVRPIHDGIFAVSTAYDDWPDDCQPPRPTNCKSCLHWITGKPYVCATCIQTFCAIPCASSERHRSPTARQACAGRQTAQDRLPSTESHQRRMKRQAAYCERQKALQTAVESLDRPR